MCLASEKKANTYFGWQPPPLVEPLRPQFFSDVVNKLWYIMGGEDGGQVSSELRV